MVFCDISLAIREEIVDAVNTYIARNSVYKFLNI